MDYNYFSRGLISDEQLKRISYLSFSREAKEIVALLSEETKKFRQNLKIAFILDTIGTLYLFLILALIPLLTDLSFYFLSLIAIIYLLFQFFIIYVRNKKLQHLKNYQRVAGDLGENLMNVIFNDYSFSLAGRIPSHQKVNKLMQGLSQAAEALSNYLNFIKEILGLLFGLSAVIMIALSSQNFLYVNLTYEVLIILTLFIVFTILEGFYDIYQQSYERKNRQYDEAFISSEALMSRTSMGFDREDYFSALKPLETLTGNINLVGLINRNLLPIIFLFLPLIFGNITQGLILLIVGLFISGRLFSLSNPIKNQRLIERGKKLVKRLDDYLQLILEDGSEITPNIYKNLRKEYLDKNEYERVSDRLIWGDLNIAGMSYETGWSEEKKRIYIDRLSLPYGKVSFLIGQNGLGKTLFGRTVTLRYANFQAERFSVGDKDLRTFSSLEEALKYFHISGLRPVHTSYRKAISVYLKEGAQTNLFLKEVFEQNCNLSEVLNHFGKHADYYGDSAKRIINLLENLNEKQLPVLEKGERKESYYHLVSTIYKHFSETGLFETILSELTSRLGVNVVHKALYFAAVAEYLSYRHFKNYLPEATLYYMDANLSQPPISPQMAMKVLFSLDVYIEGLIFVVDEPFKRLDLASAKKILEDLMSYAKSYNAVVIVLDEQIDPEILEEYKGKNALGKVMRFEDDGFSLAIKANDLEIS